MTSKEADGHPIFYGLSSSFVLPHFDLAFTNDDVASSSFQELFLLTGSVIYREIGTTHQKIRRETKKKRSLIVYLISVQQVYFKNEILVFDAVICTSTVRLRLLF